MTQRQLPKSINIIIHISAWIGFLIVSIYTAPDFPEKSINDIFLQLSMTIQIAAFFYLNFLFLIPKFLSKRKFLIFLGLVLIGILFFSGLGELYFVFSMPHPNMPPPNNMPDHLNHPDFSPHFNIFRGFFIYFIVFAISVGLKMTNEWFKNDRERKELENDKLSAELAMLKAQLNPHFFFNVLNNLCSLARSKSDDTETYIIKLSHLMRYNLYNQKEDKVSLVKEIQFIEDYIDIQKMRILDSIEIIFNKAGNMNQSLIAPMLLFPFVENAFKHGISYNENSKIEIDLKVDHDQLMFSVSNYIFRPRGEEPTKKHAGIGLQNVLKRLNIQYKNKHKISIKNNDFTFSVKLKLELK